MAAYLTAVFYADRNQDVIGRSFKGAESFRGIPQNPRNAPQLHAIPRNAYCTTRVTSDRLKH
ncbi:unnamed protein product [Gemmata massiliana]|uniref:Uncharacterized protein n=1 Tax=Gemmata massiliana TaxID=1210884 RepID=A0A6P2DHD0_9BACT|nr:unnamed protein product [Gemmata massiliana]